MNDFTKYLFIFCLNIVLIAAFLSATFLRNFDYPLVVNMLIIFCVLYLYFHKYLFLPFLGESVLPMSALADAKYPEGAVSETILDLPDVEDGVKLIYWGSQKEDGKVHEDPYAAYDKYENVGITIVKDKKATLKYIEPSEYKAFGMKLRRHLHYRLCCKNNIMLSRVYTIAI